MKKIPFLLAALVAGASLSAQTPAPAPAPAPVTGSWVLTPAVASQYMFRGARLGGPSFQPALEYDYGAMGLGVWANVPIKDKVDGQSDPEFDFYGFYSMDVVKDVTVVPGFTIYTYPKAKKENGFYKATFEPNIALNYTIGGLKLTPKLYYDFVLKGPTAEITAAYAVPLTDLSTELDFTGTYGTFKWKDYAPNNTPDIKNWGDYYLVGVALPFQVNKESKFTIGWAYTKGTNNFLKQGTDAKVANSGAVGRGVLTLSYAITF
ncbi:MAG: hypothetical protein JWQ62_1234 [Lacunisphaera sp.]|nr:hypothetical protein [Lacunisphaera sp.]